MKQQWAIYSEPAATKRSSAPPPNDRKAMVNQNNKTGIQIKQRMFFFFCLAFTEGSKKRRMGSLKKKSLLVGTLRRKINKEDSLNKPWAPVFQMIVAVTVPRVGHERAHTHTNFAR